MAEDFQLWNGKDLEFFSKELANSELLYNIIYDLHEADIIPQALMSFLLNKTNVNEIARELVYYLANMNKPTKNEDIAQIFYKHGLRTISEEIDSHHTDYLSTRDVNTCFNGDLHLLPNIISPTSAAARQILPSFPQPITPSSPNNEASNYATYDNLRIRVEPANVIYGPSDKDPHVYKNASSPRGFVFLANTSKFDNNEHPERLGSEKDVENLSALFCQMGYVVKEYINLTKSKMLTALREFSEDEQLRTVDSCFVVVMSHGSDDRGVFTADNRVISEDTIVDFFSNRNCPALLYKPKIFIFQFCRGGMKDFGVDLHSIPKNVANINAGYAENSIDGKVIGETQPIGRTTSRSDIICVYATIGGYVAFLNKDRGSWLIQAMCVVFMQNAHKTDFETLLKMVSQKLNKDFSSQEGWKQQMESRNQGFDKVFYFNPQPLESLISSSSLNNFQELNFAVNDLMTSSSNGNLSVTPPHERRYRDLEHYSRCSTPEPRSYDLQHSGSSGLLRSRHSSGTSLGSRDQSPFSLGLRPRNQNENRRFSLGSNSLFAGNLTPREGEAEQVVPSEDEVDTRCPVITGTADDFKRWRLNNCPPTCEGKPPTLKRQLSAPSENEALKGIRSIEAFLQVNELDEHVGALNPIKEAINQLKRKAKKEKREASSLEF